MGKKHLVPFVSRVKLGAQTFSVTLVKNLHSKQTGKGLNGEIDFGKTTIKLKKGDDRAFQRGVLFHEIFHAVLIRAGIRKNYERVLDAIAFALVDILEDNPALRQLSSRDLLTSTEALLGFANWVTNRDEQLVVSKSSDASEFVLLVAKFCEANDLPTNCRDEFREILRFPKENDDSD